MSIRNTENLFMPVANQDDQRVPLTQTLPVVAQPNDVQLGVALLGLGKYSEKQLAPALLETTMCKLKGIITGSKEKARQWKEKYNIDEASIYDYENFDSIINNKQIQIVYVVTPNATHRDFVVRAAQAGKHVICEKPMATTVEDCDAMIEACRKNNVMLSIGYRLHFEPHHVEMIRLSKEEVFGKIIKIRAENGLSDASGWRLDKKLAGGGPLMDVGIYCVQAARYVTGLEPIRVRAKEYPKKDPNKYSSIEESMSFELIFPGELIAECYTSYTEDISSFHAKCENGFFELSPAYGYSGLKGKTSLGVMDIPNVNQQARQMDDFAMAITSKRDSPVPGEMGRQDVLILNSIYEAMQSGGEVEIDRANVLSH